MATTAQDRVATVERFIETVWHDGDLDALEELFTGDHEIVGVPTPRERAGPEEQRAFIASMREAFPDVHYDYDTDDMIVGDDGVASSWTVTGTHRGELMGVEPTGEEISVRGTMIARFDGDRIERIEVVWDQLGMLQQLGIDPGQLAR